MIKSSKRFALFFIGLIASSATFFSCTNVDKTLGLEFIPDDEKMNFNIDTIYPDAFTVTIDSLHTYSPGSLMVGTHYDPMFGQTIAGAAFQILPDSDSVKFGTSPVYKSLTMEMVMSAGSIGDATSGQTLHVYALKERIYYDSAYYACTPIKTMIESAPIATVTYSGEDTLKIELGSTFAQKLLAATEADMIFDQDTVYKSKFFDYVKGFYIAADNSNGVNRMNYFSPYVGLTLTYSNSEVSDTTCVYSSLYTYDSYYGTAYYFAQFNTIEHDYNLASPSERIQHLNDTTAAGLDSVLYAQGFFGVTPYVKIKAQKMKDWLQKINLDASQVAIIRAELIMEAEDNFSGFDLSKYPDALGAMTRLNPLVSYSYYYGATTYVAGCLTSFYYSLSTFDGSLNKSHKKYSFNITHEVADQLRRGTDVEFYLSPYTDVSSSGSAQYNTLLYNLGVKQYGEYKAVMKGPKHSNPLKLVITYAIPQ